MNAVNQPDSKYWQKKNPLKHQSKEKEKSGKI